jgi:CrcB protein
VSTAVSGAVRVRHGLLLTGIGGALGALLRWGLGSLFPAGDGFPWTTLAVNVSGSALLAALPLLSVVHRRPWLPLLLGTGFLGGFTTMSTFSVETVALADSGRPGLAAGYVVATLLGSVAAVALVHRWTSAPARAEVDLLEGDE